MPQWHRFCNGGRVGNNVPYRVALSQQLAVHTVDLPAQRRQRDVLHLLGHGLGAVQFGIAQLQRIKLIDQQAEPGNDEHRHAEHGAGLHRAVARARRLLGGMFG